MQPTVRRRKTHALLVGRGVHVLMWVQPLRCMVVAVVFGGHCALGGEKDAGVSENRSSASMTLSKDSVVQFVKECVASVVKRDDALWDRLVDGALFPKGAFPTLMRHDIKLRNPEQMAPDIWGHSFADLEAWLAQNMLNDLSQNLQIVGDIESKQLRDLRGFSVPELTTGSSHGRVIPKVTVQVRTLGLDFDANGSIESEEKTRVHLMDGTLYWEPFGW